MTRIALGRLLLMLRLAMLRLPVFRLAMFGLPGTRLSVVWSRPVWSGAIATACTHSLGSHAAADGVRSEQAPQHAAIARRFGRRDLERHGAKTAARTSLNRKCAGAFR